MNPVDGQWGHWQESQETCLFCLAHMRTCKEREDVIVNPSDMVNCGGVASEGVNNTCREQEAWNQLGEGGYTVDINNYKFISSTY